MNSIKSFHRMEIFLLWMLIGICSQDLSILRSNRNGKGGSHQNRNHASLLHQGLRTQLPSQSWHTWRVGMRCLSSTHELAAWHQGVNNFTLLYLHTSHWPWNIWLLCLFSGTHCQFGKSLYFSFHSILFHKPWNI